MKHFGIAFGVIVATAIGGAFVYDRYIDSRPAHTAIVTQSKTSSPAAVASTNGASENPSTPAASTAIVTEETQSRTTMRAPPAQIASVSKVTKSSSKTVPAATSKSRPASSTEASTPVESAPPIASQPIEKAAPPVAEKPAEPSATPAQSSNETT